jgi:hypothetical protein
MSDVSSPLNPGTVLDLFSMPDALVQDPLLDTQRFIAAAKARGMDLGSGILSRLHEAGLLIPFYLVVDDEDDARKVDVRERSFGSNPTGWAFQAAMEGRLLDPIATPLPHRSAYDRPAEPVAPGWWDGYLFSQWQLIELPRALSLLGYLDSGLATGKFDPSRAGVPSRQLAIFLAAASARALPGIVGRMTLPSPAHDLTAIDHVEWVTVEEMLATAGLVPADLAARGDLLLALAHSDDPLVEWWPLVRHSNLSGWETLRGTALNCIWRRIAAEILFRCHEDLAKRGMVEPLLDIEGFAAWHPLHDRISRRDAQAESLDSALARRGLAPNPRVLLMVEGETEVLVYRRLLAELGLDDPRYVFVFNSRSSKNSPHLIARFATSPRLGRVLSKVRLVEGRPTVLVVVMDPENMYATEALRAQMTSRIRNAIRVDVEEQCGYITEEELDFLFQLHTWDQFTFELSNFGDDALISAIHGCIDSAADCDLPEGWEASLREMLALTRGGETGLKDISHVIGRALHLRVSKVKLAERLLPDLLARLPLELRAEDPITPAIRVLKEVRRLAGLLSGGGYALSTPVSSDEQTL